MSIKSDEYNKLKKLLDESFKSNDENNVENFIKNIIDVYGFSRFEDNKPVAEKDIGEPILDPKNQKFTAFPINPKYTNIWDKYKEQMACMWKAEEIDFSNDYNDFMTLSKEEQHFVEMILAFFAASDGIVNFNLGERFTREVKITEALFAYQFQMMMENIHCVGPDTLILTDKGYYNIKSLVDKTVNVWNGKEFSETVVKYTGDSALYKVVLSNGMSLECTPEHKWFIGNSKQIVFTKNLQIGQQISQYDLPNINIQEQTHIDTSYPPINASINTKLRWLEKHCLYGQYVNICNNDLSYLRDVQLMLTTLGVKSEICSYACNIIELNKLVDIGFKCQQDYNLVRDPVCYITVSNIEQLDGVHETYCFNEPREHAGIFNGILTGQSETYSLMLDNIVKDPERRAMLFDAIHTVPAVKMMADWAFKWIDSSESFAHRVVAFAIVEGVFFSGAFAAIFWLKKYKNASRHGASKAAPFMDGLVGSNKLIARDEGLHCKFACELYSHVKNKLSQSEINSIMVEAVKIAQNFMIDAIPVRLIGMNSDMMKDYIEYIGDRLLCMLGYKKIFNKNNPFKFMETIGLNDKTSFFELRAREYQDPHVLNKAKGQKQIVISDDF